MRTQVGVLNRLVLNHLGSSTARLWCCIGPFKTIVRSLLSGGFEGTKPIRNNKIIIRSVMFAKIVLSAAMAPSQVATRSQDLPILTLTMTFPLSHRWSQKERNRKERQTCCRDHVSGGPRGARIKGGHLKIGFWCEILHEPCQSQCCFQGKSTEKATPRQKQCLTEARSRQQHALQSAKF